MRITATIVTFATVVGLLAIQVAADQDIQSTFSNALDVDKHQNILSEYDFLPIFLKAGDEGGDMYGDSSDGDASASEAPEATSTDYCDNIAARAVDLRDVLYDLLENFAPEEESADLDIMMAGVQGALEELAIQLTIDARAIPIGALSEFATVVETMRSVGGVGPLGRDRTRLDNILLQCVALLKELDKCKDQDQKDNQTPSKLERYSAQRCSLISDTYRTMITESIARSPLAPDSAPEDLKNSLEAVGLVLHIMKISLPSNDQLSVPQSYAIPSDWLNQYRTRMAQLANEYDDIREYADGLAPVVSWSNALSACLSASNDPTGAANSPAEHLETC